MNTLIELEAQFIRYGENEKGREVHFYVDTLAEAEGIMFLCPLCFKNNGGPVRTHSVGITFAGKNVRDDWGSHGDGKPTRWTVIGGTGLHDLQLSPSIHLSGGGCGWHGFVGNSGVPAGHAA